MIKNTYPIREACESLSGRRGLVFKNGQTPEDFLSANGAFVPELSSTRRTFLEKYGEEDMSEQLMHSESSDIKVAYLHISKGTASVETVLIDTGKGKLYACKWSDGVVYWKGPDVNCMISDDFQKPESFDLTEDGFTDYVKRWLPKIKEKKIIKLKGTG